LFQWSIPSSVRAVGTALNWPTCCSVSGEDAETGPGARGIAAGVGVVESARDMRPPSKTPGVFSLVEAIPSRWTSPDDGVFRREQRGVWVTVFLRATPPFEHGYIAVVAEPAPTPLGCLLVPFMLPTGLVSAEVVSDVFAVQKLLALALVPLGSPIGRLLEWGCRFREVKRQHAEIANAIADRLERAGRVLTSSTSGTPNHTPSSPSGPPSS
jgi:hypothetical protein